MLGMAVHQQMKPFLVFLALPTATIRSAAAEPCVVDDDDEEEEEDEADGLERYDGGGKGNGMKPAAVAAPGEQAAVPAVAAGSASGALRSRKVVKMVSGVKQHDAAKDTALIQYSYNAGTDLDDKHAKQRKRTVASAIAGKRGMDSGIRHLCLPASVLQHCKHGSLFAN